jgi:hypothetical protein
LMNDFDVINSILTTAASFLIRPRLRSVENRAAPDAQLTSC